MSRVQIDEVSAMLESFASASASSIVENFMTGSTGPNVSSRIRSIEWSTPVINVAAVPYALAVNPSVPARNVKELIALASRKAKYLSYGSSGSGSMSNLAAELFKHMSRTDIVHVPYKGAGPAMADLIGGQVQMLITGYPGALPHIKSGKLRALGVTGAKRLVAAPDLPTIGETVKGYECNSSYGVLLPARAPKDIVARLHREVAAIVRKPEVQERLVALGFDPEGNTPAEFAAQIRSELAKWAKVVKVAKVQVE